MLYSLLKVPENSVVYLDTDTSVGSIILPENGELLLGESVTIKLTPDTECTGLLCSCGNETV